MTAAATLPVARVRFVRSAYKAIRARRRMAAALADAYQARDRAIELGQPAAVIDALEALIAAGEADLVALHDLLTPERTEQP